MSSRELLPASQQSRRASGSPRTMERTVEPTTVGGRLDGSLRFRRAGRCRSASACRSFQCRRPIGFQFRLTYERNKKSMMLVDRAHLTLTHTAPASEHWDEYGPGAVGVGWELATMGLAIHLAQPTTPKPDEVTFATSPDGKAFIAGSSEGWRRGAVASGTDPDAARAAPRRTTAFYTGETSEPA